jgi:hypothetical protein
MPLVRCPHCGENTFTIAGWTDHDHCATCGRPLGGRPIELGAVLDAKGRVAAASKSRPRKPGGRVDRAKPSRPRREQV